MFGENTVLAYTPTLSGLKEDIILSEYTGQLSYDFLIHTHGMRILEQDGKYIVKKPGNGNKESFELGAVQIYDSAGNFCVGEMKITEQNNGSKYILTLIAPEEFLTDPDTVYPVTIDPTLEVSDNLNGAGAIEDSVIYSGTPDSNYGGFTYLTVGYGDSTYGVGRAIFRLSALNTNEAFLASTADNILSATFHTWDGTGTTGRTVNLYELGSYMWTESGITWNNCPSHSDTIMSSASLPGAAYSTFDITNLVKQWRTGTSAHFGFILINPDETNSANKKVPCSSETAITDRRPYAVVTYSPTAVIRSSVNRVNVGNTISLTVEANDDITLVSWTTGDSSIATVSQAGVVTGVKTGNVTIAAHVIIDGIAYHAYKNLYVTIPDGVYLIKNAASHKYADITGGSVNSGTAIEQQAFDGDDTQRWNIRYSGSGYYTIWSTASTSYYYMGVSGDSTANNAVVVLRTGSVSSGMLWRIEQTSSGYFVFLSKSGNKALKLYTVSNEDGVETKQYVYADDNEYSDEWYITRIKYSATINNYFDNGFSVRYGISSSQSAAYIFSVVNAVDVRFLEIFGLDITVYSPTYFASALDTCKGTVTNDNIDVLCETSSCVPVHSERSAVINNFRSCFSGDNKTTNVLWTGHKIVSTASSGATNVNRSCSVGTSVFLLRLISDLDDDEQITKHKGALFHELAHQYGARDHYHEEDANGNCKFADRCSVCNEGQRPTSCIMYSSSQDIHSDTVLCDWCLSDILAHLENHH